MFSRTFTSWTQKLLILVVSTSVVLFEGENISLFGKSSLEQTIGKSAAGFPFEKNSPQVRKTFDEVIDGIVPVTVQVLVNNKQVALGMIVNSNGWVVTKSSECSVGEKLQCKLADGRAFDVESISRDNKMDLAMLKIKARNLPVVLRFNENPLQIGQWAITPGLKTTPLAVGVISENSRKIVHRRGLLGTQLSNDEVGVKVEKVFPNTGAAKAGLQKGDVIKTIEGTELTDPQSVTRLLRNFAPGTILRTAFVRNGETKIVKILLGEPISSFFSRSGFQNRMGGKLSKRREGFPSVFQHDCSLKPENCGGPIVDLDGKVIGLNIARAGRVESFAIPSRMLRERVNLMITLHDENKDDE